MFHPAPCYILVEVNRESISSTPHIAFPSYEFNRITPLENQGTKLQNQRAELS